MKKMKDLGLIHVRMDERLIHGQVATLWVGNLGINRIMIVGDEVVNDPIAKASLKGAVPAGVHLSILKTQTAATRLLNDLYQGQKILLITKKVETIFELIELGVPIDSFNLGNASKKEGSLPVTKSVFLTKKAIDRLYDLEKEGILISAQMVPMEEPRSFSEFYGK